MLLLSNPAKLLIPNQVQINSESLGWVTSREKPHLKRGAGGIPRNFVPIFFSPKMLSFKALELLFQRSTLLAKFYPLVRSSFNKAEMPPGKEWLNTGSKLP